MWLARNKNGMLFVYELKPVRKETYFEFVEQKDKENFFLHWLLPCFEVNAKFFPEVNWENSPKEVELKLV